jgi:hypothetical protein
MSSSSRPAKEPRAARSRKPVSILPGDHTLWIAVMIEVLAVAAAVVFAYAHTAP